MVFSRNQNARYAWTRCTEHMFIQFLEMCNPNSLKFQTFRHYFLQKRWNFQICQNEWQSSGFRVCLKIPEKSPVLLGLFGSGSGNLKVSKSQTTHALYLLSRVFFSGSRVQYNHCIASPWKLLGWTCFLEWPCYRWGTCWEEDSIVLRPHSLYMDK